MAAPTEKPAFFCPPHHLPSEERQKAWERETITLHQSGKSACVQCWIYQTWLQLGKDFPLLTKMPEKGAVIAVSGTLPQGFRPTDNLFLIDVVADGLPHPAAHHHILQNASHAARLHNSTFIPLWPQPGLIPRDRERSLSFPNIHFFGDPPNLAPEIAPDEFRRELENLTGLASDCIPAEQWHNYSETDCVVAVRSFDKKPYRHKPATKLYNAWLAGVPLVGGPESAFLADGSAGDNFLCVESPIGLIESLRALHDNAVLREEVVKSGKRAIRAFDEAATRQRWQTFLTEVAPALSKEWASRSSFSRKLERARNLLHLRLDGILP